MADLSITSIIDGAVSGSVGGALTNNNPIKAERNITSSSKDISLDSYREANRLDIYINTEGRQPLRIFSAYSTSKFVNSSAVQFGSFSQDLLNILNGATGTFGRAMWKGASEKISAMEGGQLTSNSSTFDAPISPYLKSLSEQSWTVNCVLFMEDDKFSDAETCFSECIVSPINTLYRVFLPSVNDTGLTQDIIDGINNKIDEFSDWLEKGHEKNVAFVGASGIAKSFQEYTDGLVLLNNPIQMHKDVTLKFVLGRFEIDNVLIEDITTEYGDMITRSGNNVYPAYCKVTIKFKGRYRNRVDTVWCGNMSYNKNIDNY